MSSPISATLVHIHVSPESLTDFIAATTENRTASLKEPGNLRFDFLQDKENPCYFLLYEVYENEAGAKAHKETPHYLAWRERVAEMMASPRKGEQLTALGI